MVLSPLPGVIAWPVIGYTAVLVAGRMLLFRDTIADQFLNRIFLWTLLSLLLYRCTWMPGATGLAQELALACLVIMSMHVFGLARFSDADSDVDAIWRGQRTYCFLAVVSVIVILTAGAYARAEGRSVDLGVGFEGMVAGVAFGIPIATSASTLLSVGCRAFRRKELVKERVFYSSLIAGCVCLLTYQVVSITQALTGWPNLGPHLPRVEYIVVVYFVASTTFTAVSLGTWLIEGAGLDRTGRSYRRLWPLWRDLTTAVPEIVLLPDSDLRARTIPPTRLLRMTVEIRDALLHLRPYFPEEPDSSNTPTDGSRSGVADYAHRLAHAVESRKSGEAPTSSGVVPQSLSGGKDFDTDLRNLLDLARAWHSSADPRPGSPTPCNEEMDSSYQVGQ